MYENRFHQHVPDNPSVHSNSPGYLMSTDRNSGSTKIGFLNIMNEEAMNNANNSDKNISNIESIRLLLEPDHKSDESQEEPNLNTNSIYSTPPRFHPNPIEQYPRPSLDPLNIPQQDQFKLQEINDLKQQVYDLQQKVKELQQQPQLQVPISFPLQTRNLYTDNIENPISVDANLSIAQNSQLIKSNDQKVQLGASSKNPKKLFDFETGDTTPFSVKFSFGTEKFFTSYTNPSKKFNMINLNPISYNISKVDETKEETVDYTDKFLYESHQQINIENEKSYFHACNIKLYVLASDDDGKSCFSLVDIGHVSISCTNSVYRITVKQNCIGKSVLNTRVLTKISPKLIGNCVQFVGQNYDGNLNSCSKQNSKLSIYRIKFETLEKAKEFIQTWTSIKTFCD